MSKVSTAAGTSLFIGAANPASFDKAGYEGVTWVETGEVSNIGGDVGKVFNLATFNLLKDRGMIKRKGSYDNGQVTLEYGYSRLDTGQVAIVAAAEADSTYPIRIKMSDSENTEVYFMGLIMGSPVTIGGSDDFITASVSIEIDSESNVLHEAAAG